MTTPASAEVPSSLQTHQPLIERKSAGNPDHHLGSLVESLGGLAINHDSNAESIQKNSGRNDGLYWGAPTLSSSGTFMHMVGQKNDSNDAVSFQNHQTELNQPSESSTGQRKRGESIDLFLSTSPSQLDSGFLKFRNDENKDAIPPLSLDSQNHVLASPGTNVVAPPPGMSEMKKSSIKRIDSRNKMKQLRDNSRSPSCSATGTSISSRSASPSYSGFSDVGRRAGGPQRPPHSDGSGGIERSIQNHMQHAREHILHSEFQCRDDFVGAPNTSESHKQYQSIYKPPSNFNVSTEHGFASNTHIANGSHNYPHPGYPSHQHQSVNDHNGVHLDSYRRDDFGNTTGNVNNNLLSMQSHAHNFPSQEPKPQQMFYMAVPSQNGEGQVLQPIQMVQLPGQPNAFVLPMGTQSQNIVTLNSSSQAIYSASHGTDNMVMSEAGCNLNGMDKTYGQRKRNQRNQGRKSGELTTQGIASYRKFNPPQKGAPLHSVDSRMMSKNKHYNNTHSMISKGNVKSTYRHQQVNTTMFGTEELNSAVQRNYDNHFQRDPSSLHGENDFVSSLYASPQRPLLQDLLGHVRRLSRDQVGCRLLQQSLDEEEGPKAATLILNEGLAFWGEAMVDPFGNYLFQKILEKITVEERIVLVKSVSARLVNASLNLHGTRSVQKVVELCAIDEIIIGKTVNKVKTHVFESAAQILSRALSPAAARLCIDSHGNHVIQRILLKLPYKYSHFVFDAVATSVGDVARHRHGCCVIQRCLDSSPSAARTNLVHRIVEKSLELMQDAYGNYVVQYVLDVCSDEDVHLVCESVIGKVNLLAIQKFSSNVMEKCLDRCVDRVREVYLTELSDQEKIKELMLDPFGNYVIQRALVVATHTQAVKLVDAMRPHLSSFDGNCGGISNTAGGRRIITKICRRFPDFTLGDGVLLGDKDCDEPSAHESTLQGNAFIRKKADIVSSQSNRNDYAKNQNNAKHHQTTIDRGNGSY